MPQFETVIGLEVHVHLKTKSKLFCSCSTEFGKAPNTNVCEICAGMPGALPSPNREAIHFAALLGLATGCKINQTSVFARKNYFYPDLPSGYQISQFELPICEHGHILLQNGQKRVGITRIHMENDAGKNIHSKKENLSFVDLNRAGIPLVEIVSEPDINSPAEAVDYLKSLHTLVTYLDISDGNMEEGSFRCDANISLRPLGSKVLGTRTELKNLNSFRNVQRALEFEIERQEDLLTDGHQIVQETRLYDADKNVTLSMRSKEEAQDYRYFPDPDLLPVKISDSELADIRDSLPELPQERCQRFMEMTGLPRTEVELLIQNRPLADLFETVARQIEAKKIASFLIGPVSRMCNARNIQMNPENWKIGAESFVELLSLVAKGEINNRIASDIFPVLFETGQKPSEYVAQKGLSQISDENMIEKAVAKVISENPSEVEAYKNGKSKLLSFFVGQIMRETRGKANPAIVGDILKKYLS